MNKSLVIAVAFVVLASTVTSQAALIVKVNEPEAFTKKTILKLELQNTFAQEIQSVKAVVFAMDDKGAVVGQATRWIVGGTKDNPPLAPSSKTTFNFVIPIEKPFTKTKLVVTRVVLEGGKLADVSKDVEIRSAEKQ